jgi:hypothetical protein
MTVFLCRDMRQNSYSSLQAVARMRTERTTGDRRGADRLSSRGYLVPDRGGVYRLRIARL